MIVHIETTEQFKELVGKGRVLVDFFATWCGPCKMITPIIEEVSKEQEDLTVLKIDVDELPGLAAEFGVNSIPTLLYFVDGEKKNAALGYMPKPKLLAFLA